mmetsp:Transcript_6767/g.16547  ORF Transcript_6767/g.16547 Transcript_6767/m.16547 type:complete len:404 (+) Transcript_6767:3765-4976(+)
MFASFALRPAFSRPIFSSTNFASTRLSWRHFSHAASSADCRTKSLVVVSSGGCVGTIPEVPASAITFSLTISTLSPTSTARSIAFLPISCASSTLARTPASSRDSSPIRACCSCSIVDSSSDTFSSTLTFSKTCCDASFASTIAVTSSSDNAAGAGLEVLLFSPESSVASMLFSTPASAFSAAAASSVFICSCRYSTFSFISSVSTSRFSAFCLAASASCCSTSILSGRMEILVVCRTILSSRSASLPSHAATACAEFAFSASSAASRSCCSSDQACTVPARSPKFFSNPFFSVSTSASNPFFISSTFSSIAALSFPRISSTLAFSMSTSSAVENKLLLPNSSSMRMRFSSIFASASETDLKIFDDSTYSSSVSRVSNSMLRFSASSLKRLSSSVTRMFLLVL